MSRRFLRGRSDRGRGSATRCVAVPQTGVPAAVHHGAVIRSGEHWRLGHAARVATACVAPLLAVIWLAVVRGGLGITYDSVAYASTRRLLEEGHGWHFPHLWPPGLPALLALLGTGPGAVAANCVALVAFIAASYALAHAVTDSTGIATGVAVWTGLSIATVRAYSMMWSEPVFYAAATVALLALVRIHRGGSWRWFAVLAAACNLACLARYTGTTLLAFTGLALLWSLWPRLRWRSLAVTAGTLTAASVGAAVALGANVAAGRPAMGERWPSDFSDAQLADNAGRSVATFVLNIPHVPAGGWVGAVLLVLVAVVVARSGWSRRDPKVLLAGWVVFYLASLTYSELTTMLDVPSVRYMAPALPAAAVLVAPAIARLLAPRPILAAAGTLLMVVTAAGWVVSNSSDDTPSFATVRTEFRSLTSYIDQNIPAETPILSNRPQWVVAITGRDLLIGYPDAGPGAGPRSWLAYAEPKDVQSGQYVVWFGGTDPAPGWVPVHEEYGVEVFRVT